MVVDMIGLAERGADAARRRMAISGAGLGDEANSSPPARRPDRTRARSPSSQRPRPSASSASPVGWPSVSLTFLKRSRSRQNSTAMRLRMALRGAARRGRDADGGCRTIGQAGQSNRAWRDSEWPRPPALANAPRGMAAAETHHDREAGGRAVDGGARLARRRSAAGRSTARRRRARPRRRRRGGEPASPPPAWRRPSPLSPSGERLASLGSRLERVGQPPPTAASDRDRARQSLRACSRTRRDRIWLRAQPREAASSPQRGNRLWRSRWPAGSPAGRIGRRTRPGSTRRGSGREIAARAARARRGC